MIRTVILISSSGLVLFQKEFVNAVAQPRLIGSLLTAMIEFSSKVAGMPLSYIELLGCGVSVVTHEMAKVNVALFYDLDDGPEFGKLIATQILLAFADTYAHQLVGGARNLNDFSDFQYKISEVIRNSVRPILEKLQQARGIQSALLVTHDSQVTYATKPIDQIGVQANLMALIGASTDTMTVGDIEDTPTQIWIDADSKTRIIIWRMAPERATLVVKVTKKTNQAKVDTAIGDALSMLRKVCMLMVSLHQSVR